MGKRKGAKDRHAIQWAREKIQKMDMQYNGQEKKYKKRTCNTFFLLAIVLHVRLLYFFSCPLYCMSVFCTFSLAHCIACPSFVFFLLPIVLHVRLLYFFSCPEMVQKTDMQYNGQEKKYKG
jgi:hypothetical protein